VRWEGGVWRHRHRQLQEGDKPCLELCQCASDCVVWVGGAGRWWLRFGWGCSCNRCCCRSVGLVAVMVMVVISTLAIVVAAIIVGTKRKLFYGCGYSRISTVLCWMCFFVMQGRNAWRTQASSSLEIGALVAPI